MLINIRLEAGNETSNTGDHILTTTVRQVSPVAAANDAVVPSIGRTASVVQTGYCVD